MTVAPEEARRAVLDRRAYRGRAAAIPEGEARISTNPRDYGLGWWASVRFGSQVRYLVGDSRADARRQALDLARDLGLTAKETP